MQATPMKSLQAISGITERRLKLANVLTSGSNTISDGFPESGGGGASAGDSDDCGGAGGASPEVPASDDDDGGDADSDPDGRPPHKHPSPKPATGSASNQHTGKNRIRAQHQAAQNPDFKVIGVDEFSCATAIGMSVEFLRKDRSGKRLIPFFKIGKAIRYSPLRVSEALANLEVGGSVPAPRTKKARQSNLAAR